MVCREGGDAISMVGFSTGVGGTPRRGDYAKVAAIVESVSGVVEQEPEPVRRRLPIAQTLARAVPISRCRDNVELSTYLETKGLHFSAPAGILYHPPPWFREGHPLVVPAFSGRGELVSMHGRSLTSSSKTWPTGMAVSGLLFLDPKWVRPWVRSGPAPPVVYITEGMTDYLAMAVEAPTIGITAGSADALRLLPWTNEQKVYIATHQDSAGLSYEEKVAAALWPKPLKRLPLDRLRS